MLTVNSGLISACILRSSAIVLHCSFFWETMVNLNHLWYLRRASTLVVTWVSGGSILVKVGYLQHACLRCLVTAITRCVLALDSTTHLDLSETSGSLHL